MLDTSRRNNTTDLNINLRHIICLYFSLAVVGFLMRWNLIGGTELSWQNLPGLFRRSIFISYYDILMLSLTAAALCLIAYILKNSKKISKIFRYITTLFAIFYAIILAGNNIAIFWLNVPITYQWLYYSDLAQTYTPQTAIMSAMSGGNAIYFIASLIAFFVTYYLINKFFKPKLVYLYITILPLFLVHGYLSPPHPSTKVRDDVTNPVQELIASAWASGNNELLNTAINEHDQSYLLKPNFIKNNNDKATKNKKNIILIILESVSAKAIYDNSNIADSDLKNITELRKNGVSFTSFYSPKPQSTRAIFSFLSGRYPRLSYQPETRTLAEHDIPIFPSILRDNGYHTAFFMGAEFAFQNVDQFIEGKGFDELYDIENINCNKYRDIESKKFKNINNISSKCVVDKFNEWKNTQSEKPYFSILWLNDTHFPYYPNDETVRGNFNKYNAAIKDADDHIGVVIEDLKRNDEYEDTILIIFSDHGEAFGEHNNYLHGSTVYNEETRIPLIIANSNVVSESGNAGKINDNLSDQTDFAPLIIKIAGIDNIKHQWQGSDPLEQDSLNNIYLMSTLRGNTVGVIYNNRMKYIYDLRNKRVEKYNLSSDPKEKIPLDVSKKERDKVIKDMAAWAQYNQSLYED